MYCTFTQHSLRIQDCISHKHGCSSADGIFELGGTLTSPNQLCRVINWWLSPYIGRVVGTDRGHYESGGGAFPPRPQCYLRPWSLLNYRLSGLYSHILFLSFQFLHRGWHNRFGTIIFTMLTPIWNAYLKYLFSTWFPMIWILLQIEFKLFTSWWSHPKPTHSNGFKSGLRLRRFISGANWIENLNMTVNVFRVLQSNSLQQFALFR